jgi:hypothetical protein
VKVLVDLPKSQIRKRRDDEEEDPKKMIKVFFPWHVPLFEKKEG